MDEFIKMDVFFAVTTGAIIILTALLAGVLVYVLRFLHTVNRIAADVQEETEDIRKDIQELRENMSEASSKVFRFVPLLSFFQKTGKRLAGPKKKKKPTTTT